MKNNVEYYTHRTDSHRHPKFILLRSLYGAEGWAMEGRYWALLNIIADQEGCKIDLNERRVTAMVCEQLQLVPEAFANYLRTLCEPDINLLQKTDDGCYTADKLQECLHHVNNGRLRAYKNRAKKSGENGQKNDSSRSVRERYADGARILSTNEMKGNEIKEYKERDQFDELQEKIATRKQELYGSQVIPTLDEVIEFAIATGTDRKHADEFWHYYDGQGWRKGNGANIANWKSVFTTWIKRAPEFASRGNGNGKNNKPKSTVYDVDAELNR